MSNLSTVMAMGSTMVRIPIEAVATNQMGNMVVAEEVARNFIEEVALVEV